MVSQKYLSRPRYVLITSCVRSGINESFPLRVLNLISLKLSGPLPREPCRVLPEKDRSNMITFVQWHVLVVVVTKESTFSKKTLREKLDAH